MQCQDVIAFLQYRVGFINVDEHQMVCQFRWYKLQLYFLQNIASTCYSNIAPSAQQCINALTFVFRQIPRTVAHHVINVCIHRSAAENKLSLEQLTEELKASMEWGESAIVVISHIWKEEGASIIDIQQRMLNIGQVC